MIDEIRKIYNILVLILGESKNGFDENNFQYQFPCPKCIERNGINEGRKFNLEINIKTQIYHCWSCSSIDEKMSGTLIKLMRTYGNEKLVEEYKNLIRSIRESELYKLNFQNDDFNIDINTSVIEKEELKLPSSFKFFKKGEKNNNGALKYLEKRGIGWDIIERHNLGYTEKEEVNKKGSFRVIIPSYNSIGELNYWVGRDYLPKSEKYHSRIKYDNPKIEKKGIIFNERKIQWDGDITLVEGPFDHIVVPNSIPLLGKALNKDYKLYWDIINKANANINIWLDDDAKESIKQIYSLLNHGKLYGKIRMIETNLGKDPSEIYQNYGYKGIINCLRNTKKIEEYKLF